MKRSPPWGSPVLWASLLGLVSCKEPQPAPIGAVPADAFALVGTAPLQMGLLDVAVDRGASLGEVQGRARGLVHDQLMSQYQAQIAPERARVVRRAELARQLIERVESDTLRETTFTEDQLRAEYERRWQEFNRPRAVRTTHLFLPVEFPLNDTIQFERAERVVRAARAAHGVAAVSAALNPILAEDKSIRTRELPPLAADGRIVRLIPSDARHDELALVLAQTAASLGHPGDVSEVMAAKDGYHVLYATEIIEPSKRPLAEVRDELRRGLVAKSVRKHLDDISKQPAVPVKRRRDDLSTLLSLIQQGS